MIIFRDLALESYTVSLDEELVRIAREILKIESKDMIIIVKSIRKLK